MDEHRMTKVVRGELDLEAVLAQTRRGGHDTSVTYQDIQPVVSEGLCDSPLDRCQVSEVQLDECQRGSRRRRRSS